MTGLTVKTAALRAASHDVTGLLDHCVSVADAAVAALAGMAGSAGHPAVASALSGAADQGAGTYLGAAEVYHLFTQALPASADGYDAAERSIIAAITDRSRR